MTTNCTITATCLNGKPISVLGDLIEKRVKFLKGETTEMAVTATAINVVSSLRAMTPKAPMKAPEGSFQVECIAENGAGWRGRPARRKPINADGHWNRGMFPVNLMYGLKGSGNLYRITITNPNLRPSKMSKNPPVYLVMAPDLKTAVNYAQARVERALRKESGMAKYALGIAQAKTSNRPMNAEQPSGAKQWKRAYDAAVITKSGGEGKFSIDVFDALMYSAAALKGGPESVSTALMKAANKTAGLINKLAGPRLDEPIETPFPEVQKK